MKKLSIKKHVRYLFAIAFAMFMLNKFYLRPWVIANQLATFFQIVVFSIPNFIEAILGVLLLTGILLFLRPYFKKTKNVSDTNIYLLAVGIAALYVISQEFKFHNLGGNNVYDPYDVLASIIGLLLIFVIIKKFGFAN